MAFTREFKIECCFSKLFAVQFMALDKHNTLLFLV